MRLLRAKRTNPIQSQFECARSLPQLGLRILFRARPDELTPVPKSIFPHPREESTNPNRPRKRMHSHHEETPRHRPRPLPVLPRGENDAPEWSAHSRKPVGSRCRSLRPEWQKMESAAAHSPFAAKSLPHQNSETTNSNKANRP